MVGRRVRVQVRLVGRLVVARRCACSRLSTSFHCPIASMQAWEINSSLSFRPRALDSAQMRAHANSTEISPIRTTDSGARYNCPGPE